MFSENYQDASGLGLLAQYATCQVETLNTESAVGSSDVSSAIKRKKLADG